MNQANRDRWDQDHLRVRVLLEAPPTSSPDIIAGVIERHGFAVRVCEGPDHRHGCTLLSDGSCHLVSGADVVVNMLRGADGRSVEILEAVTRERRPPAVVVEMTGPQIDAVANDPDREPPETDGVTVIRSPVQSSRLVAGINEAIKRSERRAQWWGDGFG